MPPSAPHAPQPYLSGRRIEIPQERIAADLELHDRFIGFSAELLRLALAGIAATGFFISTMSNDGELPEVLTAWPFVATATSAAALFVLAAAFALAHRFLASDGMFHHLRAIKLLILVENGEDHPDLAAKAAEIRREARAEEKQRTTKFRRSERCLFLSAGLLVAGAFALGGSFLAVLLGDDTVATRAHVATVDRPLQTRQAGR